MRFGRWNEVTRLEYMSLAMNLLPQYRCDIALYRGDIAQYRAILRYIALYRRDIAQYRAIGVIHDDARHHHLSFCAGIEHIFCYEVVVRSGIRVGERPQPPMYSH